MADVSQVVATARAAFESGMSKPLEWRIQQLRGIRQLLTEHADTFCKAVYADLRKAKHEFMMMEIIVSKNDALHAIKNLQEWAKPTYVPKSMLQMMDTMYLQKEPLGVVLILGAWNYPVQLIILPLIAAIAAGNCAVIKPSECSANTAKVFAHLLPQYLDKECFPVYNGGIPETTKLLEERFDHIFYTGSCNVGRIIMTAAAKHLTPVTLELGGKSPVYVDNNVNVNIVARRLLWGKLANAGQTCIAPDYVLCHQDVKADLMKEFKSVLVEMLGEKPIECADYARIINDRNFSRLAEVIEKMPQKKLLVGGEVDAASRYIAPTVYQDVSMEDIAMQSELFGPILPVITVSGHEEAMNIINANEKPLALYIFSNTNDVVYEILNNTSCGGVCINDTFMHCSSHNMPFGGVGNSGFGRYHGKFGFDLLSHEKPVCWRKQNMEFALNSRYMPFSTSKLNVITKLTEERDGGFCAIM